MRKLVLTLSMAIAAIAVFARDAKKTYNKSVFYEAQRGTQGNKEVAEANISKAKSIFPGWAVYTDKMSGEVLDVYGKAINVNGNNVSEKADYVLGSLINNIGVKASEWQKMKEMDGKKADHVNYVRTLAGHEVVFSKLGLRFAKDGKLERVQLRTYGQPAAATPSFSREAVITASVETADIPGIIISSKEVEQDWLWFPVPGTNSYSLHPAWEVMVKATVEGSVPMQLKCYVDGLDGKLLYRVNTVKEAFDVTVKGSVYTTSILNPPTAEPLENLLVSTPTPFTQFYNTDALGFVSNPSLLLPVNTSFRLEGLWSQVWDDPTGLVPTYSQSITTLGTTVMFPASTRHTSAYYHVNKVHEFMKSYFPSFTNLDFQLPTNIDLTSGNCNAFYNGSSINFYAAANGCKSFAEVPDVVYHEYGHGISDQYYNFMGMFTINNGALNEACSDVWGMSITGIPVNGNGGFTIPGGGYIRRYDAAPKVYPRDLIEEFHGDGEIVAGCWWDVAVNLGSVPDMTQLFTLTYDDTPDGPDGTEGQVYHDVLVSALLNDDNDNNLNNGTPHFSQIIKAFARHGIYLLGEVGIMHNEVAHQPMSKEIPVSANVDIQDLTFFQNVNVFYRNRDNGTWNTLTTTLTGTNTYTAKIPPQQAGAIIDYYFQVYTLQSQVNGTFPLMYDSTTANAHNVTIPYQFAVQVIAKDSNTFEGSVTGWTIGNAPGDDATTGIWVQAKPVASFAGASLSQVYMSQAGSDHTTGLGKCLITANSPTSTDPVGDNDVDNGNTTVVTPVFDLSKYVNPMIEYYRWYADSKGGNTHNDPWVVRVGNSASGNWKVVDSTYAPDYNWRRRIFAVKNYLSTLADVQLQFRASDSVVATLRNDGQSVVEAGVDDFFIYDYKSLGVMDPAAKRAVIAPNPADESINIIVSGKYKGTATLYDVTGKALHSIALDEAHSSYAISTRQFAPGQYVLVINTGESIQSQKIIIQHH